MKKIIEHTFNFLSLIGIFLIFLNLFGLFVPLRSNLIYGQSFTFLQDKELTPEETFKRIDSIKEKGNREYAETINEIVHNSIIHYWKDEKAAKYHIRIPVYENYILYLLGAIRPEEFGKYEYCDYKKALERGIGLCSQQAMIVRDLMREKGMRAKAVMINGHVVTSVEIDKKTGEWWVLDPDYGIVIKKYINDIESKDLEFIKPLYAKKNPDSETVEKITNLYIKKSDHEEYLISSCETEKYSYVLIWAIPGILIVPCLAREILRRIRDKSRGDNTKDDVPKSSLDSR